MKLIKSILKVTKTIFKLLLLISIGIIFTELILKNTLEGRLNLPFFTNKLKEVSLGEKARLAWVESTIFQPDSNLIYSLKPYSKRIWKTEEFMENTTISKQGFRDNEFEDKEYKSYRIMMVGDSYTFGHGISSNDKTYPNLVEKLLAKNNKNYNFDVLNAGVPGYNPDQQYRLLKTRITEYKPDLVVWNITYPGDLNDLISDSSWPVPSSLYGISNNSLIAQDARFNWLYISLYSNTYLPKLITDMILYKTVVKLTFNNLVKTFGLLTIFFRQLTMNYEDALDWASKKINLEIEDIFNFGLKEDVKLLVVFLPHKDIYNKSVIIDKRILYSFNSIARNLAKKKIDYFFVDEELKRRENSINLKYKLNNPLDMYLKTDSHPNEIGVSIFAEAVAEKIQNTFLP